MKYYVTRDCGHEEQFNLVGQESDRKRKLEWLKGQPCAACENAAAKASSSDLPQLEGSEKQVSWAMSIRAEFKAAFSELVASIEEKQPQRADEAKAAVASIMAESSAKFWIDNRGAVTRDLFAQRAKALRG